MRICVVSQQIGEIRTGVGMYANQLIPALAAAGHEATVIGRGTPPAWGDVAYQGVPPVARDPTPEGWLSFAWLAARRLRLLDATATFDVVHFLDAREAVFARARPPFVGTIHDCYLAAASPRPSYWRERYGDWGRRWAYHVVARRLEHAALRRMRLLIANSRYVEHEVRTGYALPAGALRTIYYGFDFGWPPSDGAARGPAAEVLFVGANFERKGLPGLLRAIVRVKDRVPAVRLHVVGDHASRQRMEALAAECGLADRVVFHGFLSRAAVAARYRSAAVVALPSEVEGFGITLMEAMHAGVPVIASTQGGSGELVNDGRDGYLVPPGDVPALADRLLRLLTDERRRAEMGACGRRTAERFTRGRMLDETLAVYRDARSAA